MRKSLCLIIVTTVGVAACSASESKATATSNNGAQDTSSVKADKPQLFKKDRVDQLISVTKDMTDAMSLLYTRMAPEIAGKIKPAVMPPEARDVFGCVVEKAKANGLQKQMDESYKASQEFVNYIRSTPDLTIQSLELDPKFAELQARATGQDYEELNEISSECGIISLNMQIMKDTGSMAAISAHMRSTMTED